MADADDEICDVCQWMATFFSCSLRPPDEQPILMFQVGKFHITAVDVDKINMCVGGNRMKIDKLNSCSSMVNRRAIVVGQFFERSLLLYVYASRRENRILNE